MYQASRKGHYAGAAEGVPEKHQGCNQLPWVGRIAHASGDTDRCAVRVLGAAACDGYGEGRMTVTCRYINLTLISYMYTINRGYEDVTNLGNDLK